MRQAADSVKKISLELGGNAPFIVFDDADLDAAVEGAMASKFRNSGQTCICVNRFYIHDAIYDAFMRKFTQSVSELKMAAGFDAGATQGPLINMAALEKVERHIQDAIGKGASVIIGGRRSQLGGSFFEPTIITNATHSMLLAQEETFGPLASCFRFSSEQEVLALANDTDSGLAAYFYSRDIGRVWRVASGLEAGLIGINEGIISTEVAPFGGVKESGLGREGSKYGMDDYLEIKYMLMGGI
jgi:succinate-semialdehyde dehydrogenase/glutarate-semialdehyde dehydrogenase